MDNNEQEEPKDNGECLGAAGSFKVAGSGFAIKLRVTDQRNICKTTLIQSLTMEGRTMFSMSMSPV